MEAPLTVDYQTVLDAITQLDTKTVERGGTDITSAIHSAELALGKSEGFYRAMVLLTDGEDLEEDAVAAAKEAASYGIRIFTVGIGTKEGSTIPVDADQSGTSSGSRRADCSIPFGRKPSQGDCGTNRGLLRSSGKWIDLAIDR